MATSAEQIKERLNIVDIIATYLKLDKAGINYKGRCPFHNEKTASFFVSPSRQTYHCFGCHKGGDLISFIEEIEGVDFVAALKILADRAGIKLELKGQSGARSDNQEKNDQLAVLEEATVFFEQQLKTEPGVVDYLKNRGLTVETIKQFRIGYIPAGWQNLTEFLTKQDYSSEVLVKSGLAIKKADGQSAGRLYDRFRGRIMFPLVDTDGHVVGFSGRLYDPASERSEEAKYLNSPQTLCYDKSRFLYGLDKARVAIRRADQAILVEGQMDLVMMHQSGLENTVAVSGTALTTEHLGRLKRLSGNLIMAFDADTAGVNASRRAVELALGLGFEARIAPLPDGLDPADLAKADEANLKKIITASRHVIDFYLGIEVRQHTDLRERAHAIKNNIYSLVTRLAHRIDQAHFIKKIADVTNLPEDIIWQDLKNMPAPSLGEVTSSRGVAPVADNKIGVEIDSRVERILRQIIALWWQNEVKEDNKPPTTAWYYQEIEELIGTVHLRARLEKLEPRRNELVLEADIAYPPGNIKPAELIEELYQQFRGEYLKIELSLLMKKLKEAEALGDEAQVDKYLKKCQDISNLINHQT
ncbi:MAG: DNA primase [Candidatus Vogelbacteria bacterium RIFOXYD1_FULL_44_32]|uniref:DNA primase n=1 Tax=Candidatus Vogelbacteria bacterium RIFOXYD1_FULL_44_32 TaxID=1802438 RepID=A0A1G2QDY9_9BACT|nr:MAG: DNA primase [Candidatus Vogelbacteria bacterium RIFOXYD1_FULL_44_32]